MLRSIATICFLLVFTAFSFCTVESADAQQWARDMFTEFEHDFGVVTKDKQPEFRFSFQNNYQEDIRIRDVFSSCGCTTVSASKRVLKMHETAEVICRFNSHRFDGFKQATITVRFDSPFVGEVQLNVRGTIIRGVNFSPNQIDFGQVAVDQLPERVIQVSREGNPSFRIVDVKSTFPHISVGLNEKYRGNNVVAYELRTRLKDSVPAGFSQGELYIVAEENGRRMQFPINFNAKVVSSLQLSPAVLTLSPVEPGEEVKRKVVVKADQPFALTDVKCVNKSFKVRPATEGERKVHIVDVIYTGQDEPGRHECLLEFETNGGPGLSGSIKAIVDITPEPPRAAATDSTAGTSSIQQ